MNDNRNNRIENIITKSESKIKDIDDDFVGEVIGVAQAIGGLKEAL